MASAGLPSRCQFLVLAHKMPCMHESRINVRDVACCAMGPPEGDVYVRVVQLLCHSWNNTVLHCSQPDYTSIVGMVSIPVGASWQYQSWCLHNGDTVKPAFKEHGTCSLYLEACKKWTATQKNNKNSFASQKSLY